jgi:flagellar assembly protein FliH
MPPVDRIRALPYPATEKSGVPALRAPLGLTSLLPMDDRPDQHERAITLAKNRIFELETRLATLEGEIPQVRERGRLEGEEGGRRKQTEEFSEMLEDARQSIVAAIEAFAAERKEYFRGVEAEAVKLALAIARKILHRETQIDPMLLRAVVHSAMDRLEETSKVVLRIPPAEAAGWERIFAEMPAQERPTVMADPRLQTGGCQIESRMGSIELSVDAQLAEIERGFFDLLHQRLAIRQDALACANCGVEAVQ